MFSRSDFHPGTLWMVLTACLSGVSLASIASSDVLSTTETWPSQALPDAPGLRVYHSAIDDPAGHRMLVFGGQEYHYWSPPGNSVTYRSNALWELATVGTPVWNVIVPAGTLPAPRGEHTAIYDPVARRMIVFGGQSDAGFLDETWELSLSGTPTWTRLEPVGAPASPRARHVAIYDPLRRRMLIFGGYAPAAGGSGTIQMNDTWELSLDGTPTWTELHPDGALPPGTSGHVAAYDALRDRLLFYGGCCHENEVWSLDLAGTGGWSMDVPGFVVRPTTPNAPDQVTYHASPGAAFDPSRNRLFVSGGATSATPFWPQDIFVYGSWALTLHADRAPEWAKVGSGGGLWGHSAIFDPDQDRVILMGGQDYRHGLGGETSHSHREAWAVEVPGDPVAVLETPSNTGFALDGARPNPASRDLTVAFTLASAAPAMLEVFGVDGRRILRERLELGPGRHVIRAARSGEIAPGIYLVRLTQGNETAMRRASIIH